MNQGRGCITTAAVWILMQVGSAAAASGALEPSTLFKTKCSSCHTYGKGDRVGPDLEGVGSRHGRAWLIEWIRSSETLIDRGDPSAVELFGKYRQQRMPDHDLSDAQISALLDYLDAGGPAADEKLQLRLAADATREDVQQGRRLFFGEAQFASGAVACVFCHSMADPTSLGGSLAPDLSDAFSRYRDWALDERLREFCVSGRRGTGTIRVNPSESLALRAFFRSRSNESPDRIDANDFVDATVSANDYTLFVLVPFASCIVLSVSVMLKALRHNWLDGGTRSSWLAAARAASTCLLPAIAFTGVLLGHAVMIGWPDELLAWSRNLSRAIAFEILFFALGVCTLISVAAAIRRRAVRAPVPTGSVDAAFWGVLLVALVSGLGIAVLHRWAAAWSAVTIVHYVRSLVTLQPDLAPLEPMPYLVKLHIFSAFVLIALLPFARPVQALLGYVLATTGWAVGPFLHALERQRRALREWVLRSGRSFMRTEEEE
jgi:nitrate reductase gamma subunit/mono/diheme cytochrome c family protein